MTSQPGAAGEIALRLAEIATSSGSARERDAAILRLLRERLGATFIAVYSGKKRAGKAPALRTRASDEGVIHIHPILTRAAREMARAWLASGAAAPHVVGDPRFGGWQVVGCLPGGGLAVVVIWPPDGDAAAGAETLTALAPILLLALGRGTRRAWEQHSGADPGADARASFVALVSHALRTPLNTLTGFVEIVLDQPVGPLNDRQREFLEYARASGQALTQLVEDVTLLSRADEGSLALRHEWLEANKIALLAVRAVETAAHARNVRLNLHVEGESMVFQGDGERLAHALTKLLENTVKFSPEGVDALLSVTARDDMMRFAVRDEGPGVAPEDAERIFERFYQAERTAKDHPGGYGLGLAVAQVIAHAHGGEIRATSTPGRGATFILLVPISATAATQLRTATKINRGSSSAASRPL